MGAWAILMICIVAEVIATSLLKKSLPTRWWRRVHVLAFPLYAVASVHLLVAGSEGTSTVMRVAVLGVTVVVLALSGERLTRLRASHARQLARPRRDAVPQHSARRRDVVVVAGAAQHEQRHVV